MDQGRLTGAAGDNTVITEGSAVLDLVGSDGEIGPQWIHAPTPTSRAARVITKVLPGITFRGTYSKTKPNLAMPVGTSDTPVLPPSANDHEGVSRTRPER
jgi:hypothetical protein